MSEAEPTAARPLWTCPRCRHRFVTANIWHSCSRYTLDDAFASSTPAARAAFERFVELVEQCGPVTVIAQKTRIVLMDRVRFAGAIVRRDRVTLSFALGRVVDRPWISRVETYGPRWNAHRFEARDAAEVDRCAGLPELLCESYHDLGQQRGRSGAAGR
jgi:hypothetical protein